MGVTSSSLVLPPQFWMGWDVTDVGRALSVCNVGLWTHTQTQILDIGVAIVAFYIVFILFLSIQMWIILGGVVLVIVIIIVGKCCALSFFQSHVIRCMALCTRSQVCREFYLVSYLSITNKSAISLTPIYLNYRYLFV